MIPENEYVVSTWERSRTTSLRIRSISISVERSRYTYKLPIALPRPSCTGLLDR